MCRLTTIAMAHLDLSDETLDVLLEFLAEGEAWAAGWYVALHSSQRALPSSVFYSSYNVVCPAGQPAGQEEGSALMSQSVEQSQGRHSLRLGENPPSQS